MLAGAAGSVGVLAGCTGVIGSVVDRTPTVSILAAGSLQNALAELAARVDHRVQVEAHGSAVVARLVAGGRRDPDIVALADTALFDRLLPVPWHARFATNALVVAYATGTAGGRRVAAADRWVDPVLDGTAALGRTDPDLDPLGYRTRFMLDLASSRYDRPDLADDVLSPDQVYPETELLAQFETGAIDAAVVYRSMAEERDLPSLELPDAIHLGDPAHADAYRAVRYRLSDGTSVRGDVIRYGATLRHRTPASTAVFDRLVDGDPLIDHGFTVPSTYPAYVGDVPRHVGT